MATKTKLGGVHVFDSMESFNANQGSVESNDLSLVPMQGEIIAQSLGENGYVKFSNGLIIQWGKITWGSTRNALDRTANLNINFSDTNYMVTLTALDGSTQGSNVASSRTVSSFGFGTYGHGSSDKSQGISWFAVGW